MRILIAQALLILFVSCSTSVSSTLSPELQLAEVQVVEDAGVTCRFDTPSCPPLAQFWCDAESLRQTAAIGCVSDVDCVLAEADPNCVSFALARCGAKAVLASRRSQYLAELNSRLASFCASSRCVLSGSCSQLLGVLEPKCVAGSCEARLRGP